MDIIEQMKRMLKGENKLKIIGLVLLIVLCFAIVYATNDPFKMTGDITGDKQNTAEVVSSDFAGILSSVEGAGRVAVYTTYVDEDSSKVMGVIIVAEGAKDLEVKLKLQRAAATAYGIDIDRIEVYQMKGVN